MRKKSPSGKGNAHDLDLYHQSDARSFSMFHAKVELMTLSNQTHSHSNSAIVSQLAMKIDKLRKRKEGQVSRLQLSIPMG